MKKLFQYSLFLTLAFSLSVTAAHTPPQPPGVVHVVMVWLKEPGNMVHRAQIIDGSKKLRDIPGVQDLRVGEVVPSERDVVDDSFDVALYMRFANEEAMHAYLSHPDHVNVVKEYFVPIMDRYKVYDFRDE